MSADEKGERKHHCDVCKEIKEGCTAERLAGVVPDCAVCDKKGFIDRGDGSGVACNACQRGYRMKLWLSHEAGKNSEPSPIAINF